MFSCIISELASDPDLRGGLLDPDPHNGRSLILTKEGLLDPDTGPRSVLLSNTGGSAYITEKGCNNAFVITTCRQIYDPPVHIPPLAQLTWSYLPLSPGTVMLVRVRLKSLANLI